MRLLSLSLLRSRLLGLVLLEALLAIGLGLAAVRIWHGQTAPPPVARQVSPPASSRAGEPPPASPAPAAPSPRPITTPGLSADPAFLSRQIHDLNRADAAFEGLEWRVTSALTQAIRAYLERVVLPSVERSAR